MTDNSEPEARSRAKQAPSPLQADTFAINVRRALHLAAKRPAWAEGVRYVDASGTPVTVIKTYTLEPWNGDVVVPGFVFFYATELPLGGVILTIRVCCSAFGQLLEDPVEFTVGRPCANYEEARLLFRRMEREAPGKFISLDYLTANGFNELRHVSPYGSGGQ